MPELQALRDLITQRFDHADDLRRQHSAEIARRLDDLTLQVRETNGRVRAHDAALARMDPEIDMLKREVKELLDRPEEDGESAYRERTRWIVWAAGGGAGVVMGLLKLLGKL